MVVRKNEDWRFDVGTDENGLFQVEAWVSTIFHRVYSRLTREQLKQLRREINEALRYYPAPKKSGPAHPSPGPPDPLIYRKEEEMSNRERALELADDAIERIENGNIIPDTQDMMSYALILVLADIAEQLEELGSTADGLWLNPIIPK